MLARVSFLELTHRPLRAFLALLGVSVATAMLVDMLMLGSGIQRSFAELLGSRGYELRVSPKGTLPFDTEATIPSFKSLGDSIAGAPGVTGVGPVLAMAVDIRWPVSSDEPGGADPSVDAGALRSFALGIDPGNQGLLRLIEGAAPGPAELLVDAVTAERLGVRLGDELLVGVAGGLGVAGRTLLSRVSGTAEFLFAAEGDAPIALPIADLQSLSDQADRVSFGMIRVAEGVDVATVRDELASMAPRVEIVTLAGIVAEASERLSYFRQLAVILGSVSLIVTALLIGTMMAVSISERLGTIAAMRAIGIPRRAIVGSLTAESAMLCALGGAVGLVLGVFVAGYLESILSDFPGLPQAVDFFVLRPGSLVAAYFVLLAVGAVAGLVPALRATQLEVATLLHAEEP